jgi:sugar transferase (PEP-CTERM/EpsH1 system associated)
VFLGTFVDDDEDWQYTDFLQQHCAQCHFVPLNSRRAKIKSLAGLTMGHSLSQHYYASTSMADWVRRVCLEQDVTRALAFSSPMAQFLADDLAAWSCRILDLVDVDSDKWLQYADSKPWPLNWLYRREGKTLLQFEAEAARRFDHSLLVSAPEAALFRKLAPDIADKVSFINNGVDINFFKADITLENPYAQDRDVLVFTGAMDYWPNIDAVCWFADAVLPAVAERFPSLYFYVVGSNPSPAVKALAEKDKRIVVTGRVADIRPYLQYARAAVAPLRIARGIQNKVLEAMAMAIPVIVSEQGLEGVGASHGEEVLLATTVEQYVELLGEVLAGRHQALGARARATVERDFCWQSNLPALLSLLEKQPSTLGNALCGE